MEGRSYEYPPGRSLVQAAGSSTSSQENHGPALFRDRPEGPRLGLGPQARRGGEPTHEIALLRLDRSEISKSEKIGKDRGL